MRRILEASFNKVLTPLFIKISIKKSTRTMNNIHRGRNISGQ